MLAISSLPQTDKVTFPHPITSFRCEHDVVVLVIHTAERVERLPVAAVGIFFIWWRIGKRANWFKSSTKRVENLLSWDALCQLFAAPRQLPTARCALRCLPSVFKQTVSCKRSIYQPSQISQSIRFLPEIFVCGQLTLKPRLAGSMRHGRRLLPDAEEDGLPCSERLNDRQRCWKLPIRRHQLHRLPIHQRVRYKLATLSFNIRATSTPTYLSRHLHSLLGTVRELCAPLTLRYLTFRTLLHR